MTTEQAILNSKIWWETTSPCNPNTWRPKYIRKLKNRPSMYKITIPDETTLEINDMYEGETIEEKIRRMLETGEPIGETTPILYTERKEGVRPEYDIRTDRFDLAIDAMAVSSKGYLAKRDERSKIGEEAKKNMEIEKKSERGPENKTE